MSKSIFCFLLACIGLQSIFAPVAQAYMGPGAGLGMIGSLIAVLIAGVVIVFGLIIYPMRMFLKKRRKQK